MEEPSGRFNLRARKSLKLSGRSVCSSCKRGYFSAVLFSEDFDTNDDQTQNICCDCEKKKSIEPQAKRRSTQRKTKATAATIKKESVAANNSYQFQAHIDQSTQRNDQDQQAILDAGNMVKIHFSELLQNQPSPRNLCKSIMEYSFQNGNNSIRDFTVQLPCR